MFQEISEWRPEQISQDDNYFEWKDNIIRRTGDEGFQAKETIGSSTESNVEQQSYDQKITWKGEPMLWLILSLLLEMLSIGDEDEFPLLWISI